MVTMKRGTPGFGLLLLVLAVSIKSSSQKIKTFKIRAPVKSRPLTQTQLHEVEDTIRLVTEGEAAINNQTAHIQARDFVLVIGNTGAGKSTITKFLTQPGKLESYDAVDRFLIRDINHTNQGRQSTIVSQTLVPELIIDPETKTAFYDLPGFSDTRNASVEIANSWFMKKVAESAERVKILLIVNYSSLRKGESRNDFKNMLDHATNFIKFNKKFETSVALIATKMDVAEEPEVIHSVILDFFEQTLASLKQVFSDPVKIQRATDLLNTLLTEDDDTGLLGRVAYFKQPKTAAPLTSLPDLMEIRAGMWEIINMANWAPVSEEDFGVSLSPNAALLVERSEYFINSRIAAAIADLAEKVGEFFQALFRQSPLSFMGSNLLLQEAYLKTTSAMKAASSTSEFLQGLHNITDAFSIPNATLIQDEIAKGEEKLLFFQRVSNSILRSPLQDWSRILTYTEGTIQSSLNLVIRAFDKRVEEDLTAMCTTIEASIFAHANQSGSSNETILTFQQYSDILDRSLQSLVASSTYHKFVRTLHELANATSIPVQIQKTEKDFSLATYRGGASPFHLSRWLIPLESLNIALKQEVTVADLSLQDELRNQTLEALKGNQAELEKDLVARIEAVRLETSELELNATREKEKAQDRMKELESQLRMNATRERTLMEQQLAELERARTVVGQTFNQALESHNKTVAAHIAVQDQQIEEMKEKIRREKDQENEKRRVVKEEIRREAERVRGLNAKLQDLRKREQFEEESEDRKPPSCEAGFFKCFYMDVYGMPNLNGIGIG